MKSRAAPDNSMMKVVRTMLRSSDTGSEIWSVDIMSRIIYWYRSPTYDRERNVVKNVAKERILIPPSWMSIIITIWPRMVKVAGVLTTLSPVMQLALVAVNNASMREIPLVVIRGMESKMVPIRIRNRKDATISTGGLKLYLPNELLIFANSIRTIIRK